MTIFGGVVDPKKLHFPFSRMTQTDARDWVEIEAWAHDVGLGFSDDLHGEPVELRSRATAATSK